MEGRTRGFVAGALVTVLSLVVANGRTLDLHNADSLIPVLVSLDFWLPFYWGQDRFGMLLPFVTQPIRDSFWNLVAQNALGILLLLGGTLVVARRCGVRHPVVIPIALLSLLLAWPADTTALQVLTTNQSYGPALGLYALAFALLPGNPSWGRWGAAAALMGLGAWTNAGTALLMLAVSLVAAALPALRRQATAAAAGVALSLLLHVFLQEVTPGVRLDTSHVTLAGLGEVVPRALAFWSNAYLAFFGPAVWLTIPALVIAFVVERESPRARQALAAIILGSVGYGFVMIALFGGESRHITPVLPVLLGAMLVCFGRHLPAAIGPFVAAALAATVVAQAGLSWPETARRRLVDRLSEGHAIELYAEDVAIVTGDYWRAWPYAFALNLLHERVSGRRPVLPVALRSEDYYLPLAQSQLTLGTKVVAVNPRPYFYWAARELKAELSVSRTAPEYDLTVVASVDE